jgi:hypothetical protein
MKMLRRATGKVGGAEMGTKLLPGIALPHATLPTTEVNEGRRCSTPRNHSTSECSASMPTSLPHS